MRIQKYTFSKERKSIITDQVNMREPCYSAFGDGRNDNTDTDDGLHEQKHDLGLIQYENYKVSLVTSEELLDPLPVPHLPWPVGYKLLAS